MTRANPPGLAVVLFALGMVAATPAPAAPSSELLHQDRSWEVRRIAYDDGRRLCMAQVWTGGDSFSILADPDARLRLQFFSEGWDFGPGRNATLLARIDAGKPWRMDGAGLFRQSVLFDMPNTRDGASLLTGLMAGKSLDLLNAKGGRVKTFPLAGSASSIEALAACTRGLAGDASR